MSEVASQLPAQISRKALRIVLFGATNSGKSSLLGALTQAAQTQEHALKGHLLDLSQGLAELQRRVYDGQARATIEDIVPYPVAFEPFSAKDPGAVRLDAVFLDSSGTSVSELLDHANELEDEGALTEALLGADALIVAVDASASPAQLDIHFGQLDRFLRRLEEVRGQQAELGGLPAFIVLTKCDLLAVPGDTLATWQQRIEERKHEAGQRFDEFHFAERKKEVAFGRIDVEMWATATSRPELAGSPAKPREPFGVAELSRRCFEAARLFRRSQGIAGSRLVWTILGTLSLMAAMVLLGAGLLLTRQNLPSSLDFEVDGYRHREDEQSHRARYRNVKKKIAELIALEDDPNFERLSEEKRSYVQRRLKDLKAYEEYEKKLTQLTPPRYILNERQLGEVRESLTQLTVPPEYRVQWTEAEAVNQRDEWLEDIDAILSAVDHVKRGYQKLIDKAIVVLDNQAKPGLPKRAKAVLNEAADLHQKQELPDPKTDKEKPLRGSKRLTYATVFACEGVAKTLEKWDDAQKKLTSYAGLP